MRDIKPLLLVLLSVALVSTWIYHLYDKSQYTNRIIEKVPVRDSAAIADAIRDSLQDIYAESVSELDSVKIDADSLKGQLDSRLKDIYKLKREVGEILKNRKATKADLIIAKRKINEMKSIIGELKDQNLSLAQEKARLNKTRDELNTQMGTLKNNIQKLGQENQELAETINQASTFIVTEMRLAAMDVREGGKEIVTSSASKTNKLVFSFVVQNNVAKNSISEVFVIVTNPLREIVQNQIWDSGYFVAKSAGTKQYSVKLRFEYNPGEQKRLIFSLQPEQFLKGNYLMQVYHNGILIGETNKKLS